MDHWRRPRPKLAGRPCQLEQKENNLKSNIKSFVRVIDRARSHTADNQALSSWNDFFQSVTGKKSESEPEPEPEPKLDRGERTLEY